MIRMQNRQTGFTLLELIVVVVLVVIFFSAAALRLLPLRGDAEAARVLQVVGALRSGLGMQMSARVVSGDTAFSKLASENPLGWLRTGPSAIFRGEECYSNPPGSWQWCQEENILIYRLRYPEYNNKNAYRDEFLRFRTEVLESEGITHTVRFQALDDLPELKGETTWPQ